MKLAFKGDLLDYVLGGLEKELNKAINSYSADVKKAEASMKSAQADIDKEEKKVDDAFKSATKDLDKAADAIEKAIKKVNGIQKDIREKKDKIGDKEHELHHLDFWRVDKAIELAIEIAALEVEIGALYAAKATAVAALEIAKASTKLAPVLFQPVVLAANATFEAAKGAITVAEVAVDATKYALEGIKDAIDAYRKNFAFEEAVFDGSLQALLGNKAITMKAKFKAFGEPVAFDLSFKPINPKEIGKAVDGMVEKLAKQAIDEIEDEFFGGGSSKHSSGSSHSSKSASAAKPTNPPGWNNEGPSDHSIPLKGAKYKNAAAGKCMVIQNNKLVFASCSGVKDSQLFRFSPKGDFVAVGSSSKAQYCLAAKGPNDGDKVELARCTTGSLQKWHYSGGQLKTASGHCAAFAKNGLSLAECAAGNKSQSWSSEPIADLDKLSETPQTHVYSVSFRKPKGNTCIDAADGLVLEYACDDSDYQVYNLNSSGQLRIFTDCIQAQKASKGSSVFLGDCKKTTQKWQWVGLKMQLKGSKLCLNRSEQSNPLGIKPITLGSCSAKDAEWELEPSNVDPKGRILPGYAMLQTTAGLCVEVRSKLQIDGLAIPSSILWSCNGDFNQSFSFRWNGEIRSLGKCLNATSDHAGAQVIVDECYKRPSALVPSFFQQAGKNRGNMNKQRWRLKADGTIRKIGTKLCLSANPKGLRQFRFNPFGLKPGQQLKPSTGKPGGMGSLLSLEKCTGGTLQKWAVSSKLPGGKTVAGYKQLAHTIKGAQRCLETSGDSKFRKLIARRCNSSSTYQKYALTPSGEIRQMGRCIGTVTSERSYGDGYQVGLQECQNISTQKWGFSKSGWIYQKRIASGAAIAGAARASLGSVQKFASAARNLKEIKSAKPPTTVMCITEGKVFNPADSMPFLSSAQRAQMGKIASFGLIGVESCPVAMKSAQKGTCMQVKSDGTIALAKCNLANAFTANQAFSLSAGKLVQRVVDSKGAHLRKVWIDDAVNTKLPSVKVTPNLAAAKNNVIKAVQDTFKSYASSGFAFDGRHGILQYNRDAGKCVVSPSGKGALSASALKKLQQDAAKLTASIPNLALQSTTSSKAKKQLDANRKKLADISAKIAASQKASLINVDRCVANVSHKWTPVPIAAGTWKAK